MDAVESVEAQRAHDAASVLASLASSHSPPATFKPDPLLSMSTTIKTESVEAAISPTLQFINGTTAGAQEAIGSYLSTGPPSEILPAGLDENTARAIAAASNEHNTRVRVPTKVYSDMVPTPDYSAPELSERAVSKKRQAPSGDAPAGAKKPASKKRKSEAPSDRATPSSVRLSPTPSVSSSKQAKTQPGPKRLKTSKSATPQIASSSRNGTPGRAQSPESGSEASNGELYCICRKPDDHTWMIACDGGCDDWYHGKCVNIQKEDEKLIDKYICPNCSEKGRGPTTWKPMCRHEGCRRPARLKNGSESKYCSKECGLNFMQATLNRAAAQIEPPTPRRRQKAANRAMPAIDDPRQAELGPLGGTIRASELKALTTGTVDIEEFRRLGEGPFLTPPPSASADGGISGEPKSDAELGLKENEKQSLADIGIKQAQLREKHQLLKDRGMYITMMRARVPKIAQKLKLKDVCGFDSIWSLADAVFKAWRDSEEGKEAFQNGLLEVPELDETNTMICMRKGRCSRHGSWQRLVYNDYRFEMDEIGKDKRRLDAEEKAIRERAAERLQHNKTLHDQLEQGWVEVVQSREVPILIPDLRGIASMDEDMRPAYQSLHTDSDVQMNEE